MKNNKYILKIIASFFLFSLAFTGCGRFNIHGNWRGLIGGFDIILSITENNEWTMIALGGLLTDTGTFVKQGNAGILKDRIGMTIGSVENLGKKLLVVTLNDKSFAPGVYTISRQ